MDQEEIPYNGENAEEGKEMPFELYVALKASEAAVIGAAVTTLIVAGCVAEGINGWYKTRQRDEERPRTSEFRPLR